MSMESQRRTNAVLEASEHGAEVLPLSSSIAAPASDYKNDTTNNNSCVPWMEQGSAAAASSSLCCCSGDPSVPRIVLLSQGESLHYEAAWGYGAPITTPGFLMLTTPILFGLLMGFWCGTRWERKRSSNARQRSENNANDDNDNDCNRTKQSSRKANILAHLGIILGFLWNRIGEWAQWTSDREDHDVCSEQERPSDAANMHRESGVDLSTIPKHVAVIMDGNRRYGQERYGEPTKGHWDGSRKLKHFIRWCIAEGIQVLTVYAFSTENWNRTPAEIASLIALFCKQWENFRDEALERNIRVRILSSDTEQIPVHVQSAMKRLMDATQHCEGGLCLNICMSYGSRGEILNACRSLAHDVAAGTIHPDSIQEEDFAQRLLTNHCPDPDVMIRTSGECRLSNFLLWQLSYSEIFVLQKHWPQVQKEDFLEVIRTYSKSRLRRFGK